MSKAKKPIPRPPDGWLIRPEQDSCGDDGILIVAPRPADCQDFLTISEARAFALAIIRACNYLEGKP